MFLFVIPLLSLLMTALGALLLFEVGFNKQLWYKR
jgi:hypothetical protein